MAFDTYNENEEQTSVKPINEDSNDNMTVTVDGETMTVEEALQDHSGALDTLIGDNVEILDHLDEIENRANEAIRRTDEHASRLDKLEIQVAELYQALERVYDEHTDETVTWDHKGA